MAPRSTLLATAFVLSKAFAQYPTLPLIDSKSFQATVNEEDLFKEAQILQDFAYFPGSERNRAINSYGHNATVDYLHEELSKLGAYKVERQPFLTGKTVGNATVSVAGEDIAPVSVFTYSPPADGVSAALVAVANVGCDVSDYPAEVVGNIALIHRGICDMGQKSAIVGGLGGIGAVMWNNEPGPLVNRSLGVETRPEGPYVPTVGISGTAGQALVDRLAAGEELVADLNVDAFTYNITVENVIATTLDGDQDNVYQIGGHTDSVGAGPGINDDGSGIITLLTLARSLTHFRVNNAVRFSFWAAEEVGLLGSAYYTDSASEEELSKIRLYNNFDMIASPNYVYAVYDGDGSAFNLTGPPGSDFAEKIFVNFYRDEGLPSVPTAFDGRSDYEGFILNGIPAGGLFTGAEGIKTAEEGELFGGEVAVAYDVNYHQAGDTVSNLDAEAWLVNSRATAHTIAVFGTSWEGIPERGGEVKRGLRKIEGKRAAPIGRTYGNPGLGKKCSGWI